LIKFETKERGLLQGSAGKYMKTVLFWVITPYSLRNNTEEWSSQRKQDF